MLRKLAATSKKEALVVARDRAALAILFLMPVAFVVIMSLALQDFFRQGASPQFELIVLDGDRGKAGTAITQHLARVPFFRTEVQPSSDYVQAADRLRDDVERGRHRFALLISPGVSERLDEAGTPQASRIGLEFVTDPTVRAEHRALVRNAVAGVMQAAEIELRLAAHGISASEVGGKLALTDASRNPGRSTPTSTQQNVPAYSLLAIFLLVVPLSGTFVKERDQGSLARLRSIPVPGWVIIGGKIPPYFAINLLQFGLCFFVGRFVLPLLGAEPLRLGSSIAGIAILACAASFAAIGFGLLVALFARTAEQAAAFGATAVLLMAALGGIMVPTMLMPASLRAVAAWSPLGWALDGFLDLFVRNAGAADVLGRAAALVAFALACMALALYRFARLARGA
jgi:ABC-2 type transport system permease protein